MSQVSGGVSSEDAGWQGPGWSERSAPPATPTPPFPGGGPAPTPPPGDPAPVPRWLVVRRIINIAVAVLAPLLLCAAGMGGAWYVYTGGGGKYTSWHVDRGCDLFDPSPLRQWADNPEQGPASIQVRSTSGSTFACSGVFMGEELTTQVAFAFEAKLDPDSAVMYQEAIDALPAGLRRTAETDSLGERALYVLKQKESSSTRLEFRLFVLDDNLFLGIQIIMSSDRRDWVSASEIRELGFGLAHHAMRTLTWTG